MTFRSSRRQCLRHLSITVASIGLVGCIGDSTKQSDTTAEGPPTTVSKTQAETGQSGTIAEDSDTTQVHTDYETTEIKIESSGGSLRGTITAAIADTSDLRYLGLSETESLPEDRGMLFVFNSNNPRTFVMREMDFGIDIIYVDSEGIITSIHHADAPGPDEDGSDKRFSGEGQYVLEVNKNWTTRHDIEEGDILLSEKIAEPTNQS
jgi:Uncharacterized conserved protein